MRYSFILFLFVSCNGPKEEIIHLYKNGNKEISFLYPHRADKTVFFINIFYPSGNIQRKLLVNSGNFVGKILEYSESGKIILIDSLIAPCDTLTRACNSFRTIFYENGKVAERYILKNGKYEGISQHYDINGIIVKEYTLTNNTIKNGEYREYDINGHLDVLSTYKNNNLIGYTYFFNSKGDTLKYQNNEDGHPTLPYKKWLKDGRVLTIDFTSNQKKYILWTWYKDGKKEKSHIVKAQEKTIVTEE